MKPEDRGLTLLFREISIEEEEVEPLRSLIKNRQ